MYEFRSTRQVNGSNWRRWYTLPPLPQLRPEQRHDKSGANPEHGKPLLIYQPGYNCLYCIYGRVALSTIWFDTGRGINPLVSGFAPQGQPDITD